MRPSTLVFLVVGRLKIRLEKLTSKSEDGRYARFLPDWERSTPSKESLPVHECNIGFVRFFSLYCLYTGCFQVSSKRFAHVGT